MVLIDKPEVDQSMQPCLLKNSPSFYTTPTPKGWRKAEKVIALIDWEMIPLGRTIYIYRDVPGFAYKNSLTKKILRSTRTLR